MRTGKSKLASKRFNESIRASRPPLAPVRKPPHKYGPGNLSMAKEPFHENIKSILSNGGWIDTMIPKGTFMTTLAVRDCHGNRVSFLPNSTVKGYVFRGLLERSGDRYILATETHG